MEKEVIEKELHWQMMEALEKYRNYLAHSEYGNTKALKWQEFARGQFMAYAGALAMVTGRDEGEVLCDALGVENAV